MTERRRFLSRPGATVLLYAIFLHLAWGVVFFATTHKIVTTPTSFLTGQVGQVRAGVLYFFASGFAFWGLWRPGLKGFAVTLPQNALLLMSGTTAILSASLGHYPDGVVRPTVFILVDQMPAVLAAILHCWAMVLYHFGAPRKRWV